MQEPSRKNFTQLREESSFRTYQFKLAALLNDHDLHPADSYLLSITSLLKESNQLAIKLALELFYLAMIAKKNCEISPRLLESLEDARILFSQEDKSSIFLRDFCDYFFGEILLIVKSLTQPTTSPSVILKSYREAILVYKIAIKFYYDIGSNFCNPLTLKLAELYVKLAELYGAIDKTEAYYIYSSVFMNLYSLLTLKKTVLSDFDIEHVTEALKKILALDSITDNIRKSCYQICLEILQNLRSPLQTSQLDLLINKIECSEDYSLRKNIHYILTVLFHLRAKSSEKLHKSLVDALGEDKFKAFLVSLGRDTSIHDAIEFNDFSRVKKLIQARTSLDFEHEGTKPLQLAVWAGTLEIVQELVVTGKASLEDATPEFLPPIYMAIKRSDEPIGIKILEFLLKQGARTRPHRYIDQSPLYYAITTDRKEAALVLMQYYAQLIPHEFDLLNKSHEKEGQLFKEIYRANPIYFATFIKQKTNTYDHVVPILAGNDKKSTNTPIFCMYAVEGNCVNYEPMAKAIVGKESDRIVYGICHPLIGQRNLERNLDPPAPIIDQWPQMSEKAKQAIAAIKSKQQIGPYILFGHSFGGLLAYEVAIQLKAANDEVILFLVDSIAPTIISKMNKEQYATYLLRVVGVLSPFFGIPTYKAPSKELLAKLEKQVQIDHVFPDIKTIKDRKYQFLTTIFKSNLKASIIYQPEVASHRMPFAVCFNTETTIKEQEGDLSLGWEGQTSSNCFTFQFKNCDHLTIMTDPNTVSVIANTIRNNEVVKLADMQRTNLIWINHQLTSIQLQPQTARYQVKLEQLCGKQNVDAVQQFLAFPGRFTSPPRITKSDDPEEALQSLITLNFS